MTEASTGTGPASGTALPSGPVWQAGLLAALAATVVNAVAWLVVQQLFDAGLQAPATPGGTDLTALPLSAVVFVTALTSLVGAVVLWLLSRRGPSGVRLWTGLAVAFGLLSALPAFSLEVPTAKQLGLVLFHVLATVVVVGVVRRELGRRTGQAQ